MITKDNRNSEDQEIDLSLISGKIADFFQSINTGIFKAIQFGIKHILILGLLFVVGAGIGFYLDQTTKIYDNQIIVTPNFGSTDYLYSKIDLLQSKIKERDTAFLKSIGINKPQALVKIEAKPIIDVYRFISNGTDKNFELLKLMAEDGDMNKIILDEITSKNYSFHNIKFITNRYSAKKEILEPILNYLNQDEYYTKIKDVELRNIQLKMEAYNGVIAQIDGFLNGFANTTNEKVQSDKLIYYNENTQLNDVIQTKNNLIAELGKLRMDALNEDKIVKMKSCITNIKNSTSVNGKLKMVLPILFIFIYLVIYAFINFYKKQSAKHKAS